ncbi:bifunctional alpha/beta hydrolase/OsmC family protein [Microbulbifer sp. 2205BS26-8]|uniref:bifunctional alpha/beta hydrolase/OsmC family protein n=1 Tax=Microbulbifer sp. 2205BS26-8 TaxID=3064386 RepID=UPI00274019E8|nr:bifunctional alpha/beta hydrolase/OsmC family protein [Microbulbifer sp. 2205BS26-8]MDP5208809.1 bifunctional alpha/beta hydrolase/OsmC family protein [Microbulbifer sp. 2205BS26-8]
MGRRIKLEFAATDGLMVAGLLEMPDVNPHSFALFAHCFTCGKDVVSASRIARALVTRGCAVLRFDFTGLGGSDGDFANSNFSSNVNDLVMAANFLRDHYRAPSLLIGHSLGGAAALAAAHSMPEVRGVVTIGAPADPHHVVKQFGCKLDEINTRGVAEVTLAGRRFTIKKQFLDDLDNHYQSEKIAKLKKPLLIFHSPVDATVSIHEAEKIFRSAKHPKSFISLDNADHLLTKARDAEYVATTLAAWATRYIEEPENIEQKDSAIPSGHVLVKEKNRQFTRTVISDSHVWLADEPTAMGGNDLGPDPYEHLLAALGTCTSMTIRMYARHKKIPLQDVSVHLSHNREHARDCEDCESSPQKIEVINRVVTLVGDLTDEVRDRLLQIADRCPVHQTLHSDLKIITKRD